MIALPVAYQVFRMGFYGSLVPGTAVAKEGGSANLSRGWDYLLDFAKPYWLWFAALVMLAGGYLPMRFALVERGRRRALLVVLTFAGIGVVNAAYLTLVGGDYLHARLLLPAFFTVCAPVAVIPATRRHLAGLVLVPWAIIAALALRPPQVRTDNFAANGFIAPSTFLVTTDDHGWGPNGAARRWYTTPGYYFEGGALQPYRIADIPLRDSVDVPIAALWGIGVSGYALGTEFLVRDGMGLADPLTAHFETTPSRIGVDRLPGHEKPAPAVWTAARLTPEGSRPRPEDFPTWGDGGLIPETTGDEFQEQVAWARAALECGGIEEIIDAQNANMSAGRFVHNFLHSFSNTRTRIPPDPEEAYHEFCGPGTPAEVRTIRGG